MSQSGRWLFIFLGVVFAVGVDLFLMKLLRDRLRRSLQDDRDFPEGVYLFGAYSPILTWLRKFWNALPQQAPLRQNRISSEELQLSESKTGADPLAIEMQKVFVWLREREQAVQVGLCILGVLLFCRGILDLRPNLNLSGIESETFQLNVQFFLQSLIQDHHFPTWNPYLHTGLPYLADPMLPIYNPVVTIPCFFFGVRIGFRLAVLLSYLIAAMGMMNLGKSLGFRRPVALWLGFMYAFAGQPTAHFLQGQTLFIFGFAWIPWVFTFLVEFTKTKKVEKLVYGSGSLALLYFSGNVYYSFLILWLLLIFLCLFALRISWSPLRLNIDGRFLAAGCLALAMWGGMIALHFLPLLQFRPYLSLGGEILGSQVPLQVWFDYTSTDLYRADAYLVLPAREEFYAYIGYMPFVALGLLPFGWKRENRRWIVYWLIVLAFVFIWIDLDRMPWRQVISQLSFFNQFRHVLRILVFGSFAIFLLGGYGLDAAWRWLSAGLLASAQSSRAIGKRLLWGAGTLGILFLMGWGVCDLLQTNSKLITLQEEDSTPYSMLSWLKSYDPSPDYVRHNPVNQWHLAMLSAQMRFIDAWYHFPDIRRIDAPDALNRRPLQAKPHYIIQHVLDALPQGKFRQIYQFHDLVVLEMLDRLPIAFKTSLQSLLVDSNEELSRENVEPLLPLFIKSDTIEVIAQANEKEVLVVLVTNYPGWRVKIDGKKVELENVAGYLAVRMQEGIHKYRFEFRPVLFYLGLLISLISFGISMYLIRFDILAWLAKLRDSWSRFRKFIQRERVAINGLSGRRITESLLEPAIIRQGRIELVTGDMPKEGQQVDLIILQRENNQSELSTLWKLWKRLTFLLVYQVASTITAPAILFGLSLLIYFAMRITHLADFPIYFFTDEAIQTASAAELVRDGFYGIEKVFLPTYFPNGSYWNLSLSVYVQVIPYLLFGKSVFLTRFTSLFVSSLLILLLVDALRRTICPRAWWSTLLFLAGIPTWFLHSRTAFETVLFCGLYAAFLGAYLLYLTRSGRFLYLAIFMAALAFYTYSPGQMIMAVLSFALFVTDLRYHWQQRRYLAKGVFLVALLAIPYFRFFSYHHEAPFQHLRTLGSYWFSEFSLLEKIGRYLIEYLKGLNPLYWFLPHNLDLNRHTMKGYGHLGLWNFPFILLGLINTLRQWRKPAYRLFLIAILAIPSGAALVGIGITRLLVMVIPMAGLAALGWEWLLAAVKETKRQTVLQLSLFLCLTTISLQMTRDSLVNGATWYEDYGLYGMQYGTRQVFEQKIPELLQRDSQTRLFVSSLWANGADVFVRYFLSPEQAQRVSLGSIDTYLSRKQPLDDNTVFIITPEEFRAVLSSPKMRYLEIEDEIAYPNGKTGFYVVRLTYTENADEIFAREQEMRRQLVTDQLFVDGISAQVRYSQIDDGEIGNLFDQQTDSLIRGREANPFILEFAFLEPQTLRGFQAQFGSMDFELKVYLYPAGADQAIEQHQEYRGLVPDPTIEFLFPEEMKISKMRIEIRDLNQGEYANIHIRELKFLK